ncbi:MAG: hypothetical protein EOR94_27485 [Mesorhizobium sp.]|nr:MAG: hypothetical protein EOR94_27485 [Mesorhizobium sp.]
MDFIFGAKLQAAIGSILKEEDFICAVAFWGNGASSRLGKRSPQGKLPRIICNLTSGGTNPYEVEKLIGNDLGAYGQVKQSNTLHAKVFLASDRAVVGSANVSTNGLGIEGGTPAKWIEAGVLVTDKGQLGQISAWLETEWEGAAIIDRNDLLRAREAWFRHQMANGPTLKSQGSNSSLAKFPVPPSDGAIAGVDFPLLNWWNDTPYRWAPEAISAVSKLISDNDPKKIEARLDNAFEVDLRDREALSPGRWVVAWEASGENNFPARRKPYWFYTGQILPKGIIYDDDPTRYPAILGADYRGKVTPPFELDASTIKAFRNVIVRPKFSSLLESSYPFFTKRRLSAMREFLEDWKSELIRATG